MNTDAETLHRVGQGNWEAFRQAGWDVSKIMKIVEGWATHFRGVERPWLCWNADEDWCLVQQRLVASVGWTPIVGFDRPSNRPTRTVPEAIVIDFNAELGLPVLYPHFPLEFMFLFADRLAFWHSDLLLRPAVMREMADRFEFLEDGCTAATYHSPGRLNRLLGRKMRYWELIGCTTRAASLSQFENGCGWWMAFWDNPNTPENEYKSRSRYYYDHGTGIYYWNKRCRGDVVVLQNPAIHEGHFTKIGKKDYKRTFPHGTSDAQRSMKHELRNNFDLVAACEMMGLAELAT